VKVVDGEVILTGTVAARHYKRMAEDIAERCSGVHDVRNEIRVLRDEGQGQQTKGKSVAGTGSRPADSKSA